ncbi:MAG TPA: hypothetical protein VFE36_11500 [Candidatus Baltobacteraceae bacterium]|nr:hypothetical protein [Candidatus Baltobacteraceae bacterium]
MNGLRFFLLLILLILVAAMRPAAAAPACTQEMLSVRGTPVTIGYCVEGAARSAGGDEIVVPTVASYGAPGGSFSRTRQLHFVAGEGVSRVIENLDLGRLGLNGTLHLTLAYSGGLIRVEGALLTPGAITIK